MDLSGLVAICLACSNDYEDVDLVMCCQCSMKRDLDEMFDDTSCKNCVVIETGLSDWQEACWNEMKKPKYLQNKAVFMGGSF